MSWFRKLLGLAPPRPPKPADNKAEGLTWAWSEEHQAWYEVCDFCGGNCGQCGITGRVGNVPFDMARMARKAGLE